MLALFSLALFLFQADVDAASPSALTMPAPAAVSGGALTEMIHNSGPVALAVLIVLLLASIFSWSIMLSKWAGFAKAKAQGEKFRQAFNTTARFAELSAVVEQFRPSPLVNVFTLVYDEYDRQNGGRGMPRNPAALERAAQTASSEALTRMESRMTWLATIANAAPFIGLLGTVMGIIDAFHGLGTSGAATLRSVAPGISEALITTAAGLVVAIPALVGYNQLTAQLRDFASRMDDFARDYINLIENLALHSAPPQVQPQAEAIPRRRTF